MSKRPIQSCNCEYCRQTWTMRWIKNKAKLVAVPFVVAGIWLVSKFAKENA